MQLDPIGPVPSDFRSSAEALGVGTVDIVDIVDIVELNCGPAVGSWEREAIERSDRLRLALVAPTLGATGGWHGRDISLSSGAASLLGSTDGIWRAPSACGQSRSTCHAPRLPPLIVISTGSTTRRAYSAIPPSGG